MKKYLLDTNICISILRKDGALGKVLSSVRMSQCYISEITLIELKVGAILGKAKASQGKYVDQCLDAFVSNLTIIPISTAIDKFAEEKGKASAGRNSSSQQFRFVDRLHSCSQSDGDGDYQCQGFQKHPRHTNRKPGKITVSV